MALAVAQKDEELVSLRGIIAEAESTLQRHVREAIARRDEELRAMIIKKEAEVTFIDYGNQDTVSFSNIRPLDPKFRSLPGQAQDARLRSVSLCLIT